MGIQRIFKAIGSFSYIYNTKKDIKYIQYIGFAFENLRSKLLEYKEFDHLRILLSKMYYDQ